MDSDEVLGKVIECDETFLFSVDAIKLFVLISHLQVSQRYINGGSGAIAEQLIDSFINLLCREVPEVRELLERGNDPAYDVTAEYFDQEF
ncbi:MAG: hypothetical protein HC799_19075 [Limnothrix sp. RL_2_0]|nr:hypothetical protein [Limnothrix sp. RL_2_0]